MKSTITIALLFVFVASFSEKLYIVPPKKLHLLIELT